MTCLSKERLIEQVQDHNLPLIMRMLSQGKSKAEIARALCIPAWRVTHQVHQAMQLKIIIPDAVKYAAHEDIQAVDYSNHDEYNRHFAGAEFEDTRPPEERGLDWPPKGILSCIVQSNF